VIQGMIDIFGGWIDKYGIDGFRIDTARHVNPEFWQAFIPAMLARARAKGIPNFHIFGEVYDPDPAVTARFTRVDAYPAVLDFPFQKTAVEVVSGKSGTDALAKLFAADAIYAKGADTAAILPTFLGNHDMGRVGFFVKQANPNAERGRDPGAGETGPCPDDVQPRRADPLLRRRTGLRRRRRLRKLAPGHVRQPDAGLCGGAAHRRSSAGLFDRSAPLPAIAEMARIRAAEPALRHGRQVVRAAGDTPGLFAMSRIGRGRRGDPGPVQHLDRRSHGSGRGGARLAAVASCSRRLRGRGFGPGQLRRPHRPSRLSDLQEHAPVNAHTLDLATAARPATAHTNGGGARCCTRSIRAVSPMRTTTASAT
jgi:hypothetical protein